MTVITPENDRLLTQRELAKRWGVTREYLQKMRRESRGPAHVVLHDDNKGLRYKLSEIVEYENRRVQTTTAPKEDFNFGKKIDAEKQD